MRNRRLARTSVGGLLGLLALLSPAAGDAHPMGNFSISHYGAIRVLPDGVELRYLIDLAEIPTFQEIQDSGIAPEAGHPGLGPYLATKASALGRGITIELNGRRLPLESAAREILFTPGAGGLPTMKIGIVYRAAAGGGTTAGVNRLVYRDENFSGRAGWKEVIAVAGPAIVLTSSSVPERDRSRELADYPTDMLNSPPQTTQAWVSFAARTPPAVLAHLAPPAGPDGRGEGVHRGADGVESLPARAATSPKPPSPRMPVASADRPIAPALSPLARRLLADGPRGDSIDRAPLLAGAAEAPASTAGRSIALVPNVQARRRDPFTDLIATPRTSAGMLLFAALAAAILGAFHALEPGHGKTVVAAYLVGSKGTARHAMLLGLIVTTSHTAGVYLLGAVTLSASRYVVPDRLYPWLGALSGLIIAGMGLALFLKRWAGPAGHRHHHSHAAGHQHDHSHEHTGDDHPHAHDDDGHHHAPAGAATLRELLALGITGGIVPCPAALVVLLSAVALHRVGMGLLLIAAFSAGLAAVLIAIGLLMIYAGRLMGRVRGEGRLITRWLPLTSSAVITVLGVAIALRALGAGGVLSMRLG